MAFLRKKKNLSDKIEYVGEIIEKHYSKCPIKMNTVQLYADEMERNRKNFEEVLFDLNEKVVPRIEDLEKRFDRIKIAGFLTNLPSGGEKNMMPNNENTDPTKPHSADLDGDGEVSEAEKRLFDFMMGIYNAQAGTIQHTQRNSLWTQLGTMVFLLVSTILQIVSRN